MTHSRLLGIVGLVGLLGAFVGCGSKPTPETSPPDQRPAAPQPGVTPPGADPTGSAYELDPAKHVFPSSPAAGRLAGKAFTPDRIELEENKLSFRQGKDFFADLSVDVFLHGKEVPPEALKVVVRPSQKWTDDIPSLHIGAKKEKDGLPVPTFVNEGYALTLELGKVEKGKRAGKVYLCLPGAEKSYLAGTFMAERKRSLSDAPGDEDVPFIQGTVSPPLKKGQSVTVGYVGIPTDGKVISDGAGGSAFGDDGSGGGVRSMSFAPRAATVRFEKFHALFDFTNLPPGRYLVHARVKDGPSAWGWTTVAAGGKVTADLKLDEKNVGTVEVKLPPGESDVRLIPTDLGTPPPDERFLSQLAFSLDLRGEAKDGKATIAHVPAGKYQVRAGNLRADVEVSAGKTAAVELKPAKK